MPLLEVIQTRHISASVRLDETTATQVDQYAAFIHATADDVVDKALNYVFSKDRDFQEFLKTSQAGQVTPSLRIRKAAVGDSSESPARKTVANEESVESVPRRKRDSPQIPWEGQNGASHRKNDDTPPLTGWCEVNPGKPQDLTQRINDLASTGLPG